MVPAAAFLAAEAPLGTSAGARADLGQGAALLPRARHFYSAVERTASPLEPALRSLVQARISQLNDCAFCVDLNSMLAAERAGAADKVLAVAEWRDSVLYTASRATRSGICRGRHAFTGEQ
jgi:AhpD family alkylhydroperoxidase